MAAVTVTNRVKGSLGPMMIEIARITIAADGDTFESNMQGPLFATAVQNTDGNADAIGINAAVSGKTVTFNHSSISSTVATVFVVGF
jgi:hypothetical protein